MNPLSKNRSDILQTMTQLSSLLLFRYLLKSLTLLSTVATKGPWFVRLNSFTSSLPPVGCVTFAFAIVSCCPERASARSSGHCVEALASPGHACFLYLIVGAKKTPKNKRDPRFRFKSTRRRERMKTKWAAEMFRGSDGEIRDEAEKRKPLCVSTGLPGTIIPPHLLRKAATFACILSG